MSLYLHARKHPELAVWTDRGARSFFPGCNDRPAPVFLDVSGVEMNETTMGRLDRERIGELRAPFSDAWIEWNDQGGKDGDTATAAAWVSQQSAPFGADGFGLLVRGFLRLKGSASYVALPLTVVPLGCDYKLIASPVEDGASGFAVLAAAATLPHSVSASVRGYVAEEIEVFRGAIVGITLYTYSLLNCRNIALEPIEARQVSARIGNRRQRREHLGLVWHRLVIIPTKGIGQRGSKFVPHGTGECMTRAHLVRGHFKTYSAERPLFGRHSGRFWWSPLERGDRRVGVVLKDYEVRSEATA